MTKKTLTHILNQRGRRKQREQEEREEELLEEKINDPRRKSSFQWLEPLIRDDE